ncbi:MAG: flagellar M-ring protein FliF [Candidatus Gastranaerophilales bacterium]|nr:flagellar M-ring protein FliF [Candidatus Gastranaerophilales bacterium]
MNEHVKLLIEDIKKLWLKLDINQKFSIAALLVAMFVVGIFFIFKATEPNWTVLYSELSKEDVKAITESLKKSGYGYKLSDDKTTILVRNQDKEDLRLFVAENDLIKDTTGGFELLDDLQLGSTDFKNKLTKQRIFQGELTRSIEKISGVKKARVQLAEPERSIFSDNDEAPSASVVLILEPSVKLKASQIMAIKNLVAYSVPRLTTDRVFLTDQFGNTLSEDVSKNSSDMQTYRTNFEKEAAKKIKDTLETIMGKDNVSVQVSSVMDFNQTRATIESYTPNKDTNAGVILTRQGEKEIYTNPKDLPSNQKEINAQTPAPTTAQQLAQNQMNNIVEQQADNPLLNQAQGASAAQNVTELPLNETPAKTTNYYDTEYGKNKDNTKKLSYEKEKSATTYAVTKEIKQVVYAPGSVIRMSVAVAVNKILTEAEKEEIKNLVMAAAGMDTERGDVVNVSSLKFTGIDNTQELEQDKKEQQEFILEVLTFIFKNVSPVFIILILGLIALNNFGNIFKAPKVQEEEIVTEDDAVDMLPSFDPYLALQNNQTNTDDFYQQDIQFTSAVDKKKSEIINSILENPEEAARILTSYIKE